MTKFHPNNIRHLVFDLVSLTSSFDEDAWDNFIKIVQIFDDRDYEVVLISESDDTNKWNGLTKAIILQGNAKNALENNPSLIGEEVFWITDDIELQSSLQSLPLYFGGSVEEITQTGGLQYHHLHDLLYIFHPSHNTAIDLSSSIVKLKQESPQVPLTIGIGGPDECGHAFFAGELTDALEDQELLVTGIDLTQIVGTEFVPDHTENQLDNNSYWRSTEIRQWLLNEIFLPYSQGQRVYIEEAPDFLEEFEITSFPFFLAPEMILLTWGTTLFVDEFKKLLDLKIHLELSAKVATARLFAINDRENFDPSFIETYLQKEGKHYQNYLQTYDVENSIDFKINFNNFNAFRIIS